MLASYLVIVISYSNYSPTTLICPTSGPFGKLKEGREMHKAVDLILDKPGMGMDRMKSRSVVVYEGVVRKSYHVRYSFHSLL